MEYLICLKQSNNKIVGCTSISLTPDLKEIKVKNLPLGTKKIDNAVIGVKGIKSTNGALTRYPIMKDGKVKNQNSYILLGYIDKGAEKVYIYCNYQGKLYKSTAPALVNKMFANAKVVRGKDLFLAFISGECPKLQFEVTKQVKEPEEVIENTEQSVEAIPDIKETLQKAKPSNSAFLIESGNIQEFLSTYMNNLREFIKDPNVLSKIGEKLSSMNFTPVRIPAPTISPELKNQNYNLSMLGVAA